MKCRNRHIFIIAFSTFFSFSLASFNSNVFAALQEDNISLLEESKLDRLNVASGAYSDYLVAFHAQSIADYTTAADIFFRLWKKSPNSNLLGYRSLETAILAGEFNRALEVGHFLHENAIKSPLNQNNNILSILLSFEHLKNKRYMAARREAQRTIRNSGIARLIKPLIIAWSNMGLGYTEKAMSILNKAEQNSSITNIYRLNAIIVDIYQKDYKRATISLKELMDGLSPPPGHLINLYAQLLLWGQGEKAAKDYIKTLTPSHSRDLLAENLFTRPYTPHSKDQFSRPDLALAKGLDEFSKFLLQETPTVGLLYARVGSYLDPKNASTLYNMRNALFDLQRYDEVIDTLAKIDSPRESLYNNAVALAAETEQKIGRADLAIKRIEKAIIQFPLDSDLLIELGQVYQHEKQYEEAIKVYTRTIALRKNYTPDWSEYYFRGISYERTQQWEKAEQDFLAALKISPDNPYILNYLGYSWVDQNLNIKRALTMLEKAVAIEPNNPYIIDSYGWALYRMKKFEAALPHLERAVLMEPSQAVINDHLGDVYWYLGRKTEAKYQWSHALSLEVEDEKTRILIQDKLAGKTIPHP